MADKPLSEFELIRAFFSQAKTSETVHQGIGDDCAILSIPDGYRLAVSIDTAIAGRHFPSSATPFQIAQRSFCTALSDLAAMGAKPAWFTLALSLPESDSVWLQSFSEGLFALADHYQCHLVGGDTTRGPLTISIQVHGFLPQQKALTRSAAQPNDLLYVTGSLGDGGAALALINGEIKCSPNDEAFLLERFYAPKPQINTGLEILDLANAAIDISDGLYADLQHIANASEVDIHFNTETLPLSSACLSQGNDAALAWALSAGDDYQLAFTVSQENQKNLDDLIREGKIEAYHIGEIAKQEANTPTVIVLENGKPITINALKHGYQHFAS